MATHSSGKSHGWRSLVGCSLWGREELDTTERLHFSLSCIGEGNGNPLQCSCLENPRDGGAWWAAVYGVTQSRTRLKWLSSSNSSSSRTLLVIQWLRICLPVQRIWVWSLVWEDPMCCRTAGPRCLSYWSPCSSTHALQKRSHRNEMPMHCH